MIQDSYSPAHVTRNREMQITRFQDYSKQSSSTLVLLPGKHQWDDTYDEEHKGLYFEAVNATSKVMDLFFSSNSKFDACLLQLLSNILTFSPEGAIWGGTEERYKK